ncbi:Glu/Leu/Phe/Val family dehydrogenase [Streptosporangium amethystogenes]|uniref:Glu/Leu/Phe/Val family dehydrogenase n=1 Tax=Streptosporangium amethystogenes TaxID=2002 RepID=UPI0004C9B023|nr:Glu/Leu/Phe/Val dehydrogenase [Streptosporangium amethystogenes]
MREINASWMGDEMGPARVVFLRPTPWMEAVVVVDNLALGPAVGGVRQTPAVSPAEVARLARAMTLKNAAAGLPFGGGKAGITLAPIMDSKPHDREMRAFARAIEPLTDYIPGPDMGTDESCMAVIHDEIGRSVGLPGVLGGIPLDELGAAGYGLAYCAQTLAEAGVISLEDARVIVQGFGAVGTHAALMLKRRGAVVIAVSDSRGAISELSGLDVEELIAFKHAGGHVADFPGGSARQRDEILTMPCELLIPAAQPDVFTKDNARHVRAQVILQGANIPATPEAEQIFHERGVLCVPDVIANVGGVICATVEYAGGSPAQALATIEEKIRSNTTELMDRVTHDGCLPRKAAIDMAMARIRAAEAYRRRF